MMHQVQVKPPTRLVGFYRPHFVFTRNHTRRIKQCFVKINIVVGKVECGQDQSSVASDQ
jgi:hypothetical protein